MTRKFEMISKEEWTKKYHIMKYFNIKIPERSTTKSAGYDFYSPVDVTLQPNMVYMVPTGIKAFMYTDEVLQIYIRSSMAIKHGIKLTNAVGIIDADYVNNEDNEGHIFICLENTLNEPYVIKVGDKIAQGIFIKYLMTEDPVTNERTGGIGSTGK